MKLIKITIHPASDGEVVSGSIFKQRLRNGTWIQEESFPYVSDTPEAERVLLLENDQRLVIEGSSNVKVVYDRVQSAARPVMQPPKPRPIADIGDDGYESHPVPLSEQARVGDALLAAMQLETRDRLITEARNRLKQQKETQK